LKKRGKGRGEKREKRRRERERGKGGKGSPNTFNEGELAADAYFSTDNRGFVALLAQSSKQCVYNILYRLSCPCVHLEVLWQGAISVAISAASWDSPTYFQAFCAAKLCGCGCCSIDTAAFILNLWALDKQIFPVMGPIATSRHSTLYSYSFNSIAEKAMQAYSAAFYFLYLFGMREGLLFVVLVK
jgi:hypothetical protein